MRIKIIALITIAFVTIGKIHAQDYTLASVIAFNECENDYKKCDYFKKLISQGISYHGSRQNYSYNDKQAYCALLLLRIRSGLSTPEQEKRDGEILFSTCSGI